MSCEEANQYAKEARGIRAEILSEAIKMKIAGEDEIIKRRMKVIRKCVNKKENECGVVLFVPEYIRELQIAIDKRTSYKEKLKMLEFISREEEKKAMERYEKKSGTFDIVKYSDVCLVISNRKVVFEGIYSECRKYIENQK